MGDIMSLGPTNAETAYVVGRGPSLLRVTRDDLGSAGPVIVLNRALDHIRTLYDGPFAHRVYSQQKDGCVAHDWQTPRDEIIAPPGHVCATPWMVQPRWPEALIVSSAESRYCFENYRHLGRRAIVDVEHDLALPWHTMSATVAVRIAILWGAARIVMLGFDSWTHDDNRTVEGDRLVESPHAGYRLAAAQSKQIAHESGVEMEWVE